MSDTKMREALLDAAAASTYPPKPKPPLTVAETRLWRVVGALEDAMDVARDVTRSGSAGEREVARGLIGILDGLHDLACGRAP